MKNWRRSIRWLTLALVVVCYWVLTTPPNRAVIRNRAGDDVSNVGLTLSWDGTEPVTWNFRSVGVGASVTVRHGFNDSRAKLAFTLRGATQEHVSHYIDLWCGEGWVFEIQPDGTVVETYDHAGIGR